jgi:hypothetical protein
MSGTLTVVGNPRRRRRKARRRRVTSHGRKHRRRIGYGARLVRNPRRRRRSRRSVARRRRHRNPMLGGGGINVNTFIKGITGAGIGAIGARLASNLIKNQFMPTASPVVKIAISAAVGIGGGFVLGKFLKQKALANGLMAGAAVIVALDIYDLYIKPMLPANLQDYQYGSLEGWAPQPGMSSYQTGSLNDSAYGEGAY